MIRSGSLLPSMLLHFTPNALLTLVWIAGASSGLCPFCHYPAVSWGLILGRVAIALWSGRRPLGAFARRVRPSSRSRPARPDGKSAFSSGTPRSGRP